MEVKLLTTQEVAEKLHCSTHHVAHLRQHGLIRGTRFAKYWMYTEEDINNFILAELCEMCVVQRVVHYFVACVMQCLYGFAYKLKHDSHQPYTYRR